MKQIRSLMAIAAITVCIASCGNQNTSFTETTDTSSGTNSTMQSDTTSTMMGMDSSGMQDTASMGRNNTDTGTSSPGTGARDSLQR